MATQRTARGNFVDNLVIYTATGITADTTGDEIPGFEDYKLLIFQMIPVNNSGTTPTLNVRIQDSIDRGATWHDIVSFTQITTVDTTHRAAVSAYVVPNPAEGAIADGTLAAGSVQQGPFGGFFRVDIDVGGTNPDYDVTVKVSAQR